MASEIFTVGESSFLTSMDRDAVTDGLEEQARMNCWAEFPDLKGATFSVNPANVVGVAAFEA